MLVASFSITSPTRKNAVSSETLAACCMLCVTTTTVYFFFNSSIRSSIFRVEIGSRAEAVSYTHLTLIWIAADQKLAGIIALSDTLRQDAALTIQGVKDTGIIPVLLTGDHENAARHIAELLHIDQFKAGCLPEEKLDWIENCQKDGGLVCMMGDGINDAPALKKANVGIAMGGIGSDIAVDAADIALVNDEIHMLPHLLRLSKQMMLTIKCCLLYTSRCV